jgi:hypothetical protein
MQKHYRQHCIEYLHGHIPSLGCSAVNDAGGARGFGYCLSQLRLPLKAKTPAAQQLLLRHDQINNSSIVAMAGNC